MLDDLLRAVEDSAPARAVREGPVLYPAVEIVHLIGLAVLVGAVTAFDLRLMGVSRVLSVRSLGTHLLRWTWAGFAVAALSGALLFAANATTVAPNPAFQVKLAVIAFAGCNAAFFHFLYGRSAAEWEAGAPPPLVRLSGAISLVAWLAAIACGRLIAYT